MCDYSMHAIASRPAKVGETLVSTDFRGSCTRGFPAQKKRTSRFCLLPGTELVFEQNVRHRGRWFGSKNVPFSVAQFCKLNPENPFQHHDALAFPDGTTLLVDSLVRGQRARVLQLPVSATEIAAKTLSSTPFVFARVARSEALARETDSE